MKPLDLLLICAVSNEYCQALPLVQRISRRDRLIATMKICPIFFPSTCSRVDAPFVQEGSAIAVYLPKHFWLWHSLLQYSSAGIRLTRIGNNRTE